MPFCNCMVLFQNMEADPLQRMTKSALKIPLRSFFQQLEMMVVKQRPYIIVFQQHKDCF